MSLLLDRLYPAKFKGAKFFFRSENRQDGRRYVIHRYPNKDDDPEDIGKDNRVFNVNGVIKGFFYKEDAKALEDELNSVGAGIFLHPEVGVINCVCIGFTRSFNLERLGKIEYSIVFKEVKVDVYPVPSKDLKTVIANLYNKFYSFMEKVLKLRHIVDFINNVISAAEKLGDLVDELKGLSNIVSSFGIGLGDFTLSLKRFYDNRYKIASPIGNIGSEVTALIFGFDGLVVDDPQKRFDLNNQLFGFGKDDVFLDLKTKSLIERNRNTKVLNGAINSLALINAYDAAKSIVYTNDEQLNEIETSLDKRYDELINSDKNDLSSELIDKINEIRVNVKKFFDQERLNISKVIEITTNDTPLTVLTYQYYGNTDNFDELLTLNSIYKPERVSGAIKVFEA